jgi:LmbE family N-acetylglucosaminyl deacetylase
MSARAFDPVLDALAQDFTAIAIDLPGFGDSHKPLSGRYDAAWFADAVAGLLDELRPEVVLTHPYEGGHTDHDATAFAVHLACGMLRREGTQAPIVLELTSYHNRSGKRVHADFLPFWPVPMRRVDLPPEAQLLKAQMFRYFTTQQKVLSAFPLNVERFRLAPRYIFTVPPHDGPLDYERYYTTITGAEWRANAERALHVLRAKRRVWRRQAS